MTTVNQGAKTTLKNRGQATFPDWVKYGLTPDLLIRGPSASTTEVSICRSSLIWKPGQI